MDSTEAYIRHRERLRERERINKLAKLKKKYPNVVVVEEKVEKLEDKEKTDD